MRTQLRRDSRTLEYALMKAGNGLKRLAKHSGKSGAREGGWQGRHILFRSAETAGGFTSGVIPRLDVQHDHALGLLGFFLPALLCLLNHLQPEQWLSVSRDVQERMRSSA